MAAETIDRQKQLLNGFRRYHSVYNHCHGPDGLGSSFGPSLVDTPPEPQRFRTAVIEGVRGTSGVMNGFGDNADVMKHLDEILAYVDARARGELGRGRPR
jgi:mono/diheme cytochrome c family protein